MEYIIKRKQKIIFSVIALLILLVITLPAIVFAAAVTVSLSPSASSVQQGNTFTVNVNLSTGSATILDAVGRVNFNTSQLQFISASYTPSSAWGSQGPEAGLNGSYYTFDVSTTTNPSGNLSVVQITFRALANSGTSSITLSDVEVGDGDTPPNPNPAIHTVSSQNTSINLIESSSSSPATDNNNQTDSNLNDEEPVPVSSFVDSVGYLVEIKIIDKDGVPQPDLIVNLADIESTTNANGIALFYGVTVGQYTVAAEGVDLTINVTTGEPTTPQTFELTQVDNSSNTYIVIGVALAIIITILGTLFYKKEKNR